MSTDCGLHLRTMLWATHDSSSLLIGARYERGGQAGGAGRIPVAGLAAVSRAPQATFAFCCRAASDDARKSRFLQGP